jgi:hypothetical protein
MKIAEEGSGWQVKIIKNILLKRAGRNGRIWAVFWPKTGKTAQKRAVLGEFSSKTGPKR